MSLRKSISNTFTVTTLVDGESAPYYFEEKYAWSNDSSTKSVTTPPSISGGWQTSIPPSNGYAYLWRMSIRHVWNESTRSYTQEAAQYFRMSGTNGTSIHIKGHVPTVQNLPTTHLDGDAYVVDANGHLYMWSDESGSWVDIGVFQGEAGKTYYTHIAWASQVNYSGTTVTSVDGFITDKSPNDTTHMWMGVYIDEQSGQDESNALRYTWSYTKGVDGISVQARYAPNDNPTARQIHTTWQNGDLYMQTKRSNETDWSSWHKIVGESGGETDYSFNISKEKTSASATTAPSNCYYNTWQDAPISPTSTYPYLWMKIQKKDGDGNNVGDASYARVTGELGIDYEIRCAIDSIKIPKDTTSTSVSTTFNFYYKESGKTPIAYNAYYGIYYRIGTTYTRISSGSGSYASLSSYTVQSNQTAIVVFIFSASYSGNDPMSQSYLSKLELPIYKDGDKGDKGDDAKYIYIRGTGHNNDAQRILNITSTTNVFSEYGSRGFVAARINRSTLAVSGITWFDVYGGLSEGSLTESDANANTARTRFVTYLANTTSDYFLVVASQDAIGFNDAMVVKLREFGLGELDYTAVSGVGGFRTPFAFLGYKGLQQGYALYQLHGEGENDPYAEVMAYVSNGIFMSSKDGKDGARGKVGRFFYYAQEWTNSSSPLYIVTDAQAPYFSYNGDYYVFNPEQNYPNGISMHDMGAPSTASSNWKKMWNDFKYIITQAIFGKYAHFGSFIINGDWMISQYGTINGSQSTSYTKFYPEFIHGCSLCKSFDVSVSYVIAGSAYFIGGKKYYIKVIGSSFSSGSQLNVRMYNGSSNVGNTINLTSSSPNGTIAFEPTTSGTYYLRADCQPSGMTAKLTAYVDCFVPNFAVDGLTGETYQQNTYVKGTIRANILYHSITEITLSPGNTQTVSDDCGDIIVAKLQWTYTHSTGYLKLPHASSMNGRLLKLYGAVLIRTTGGTAEIRISPQETNLFSYPDGQSITGFDLLIGVSCELYSDGTKWYLLTIS